MRSSLLKVFYSNNPWERFGFAVVLQNVHLLILSPCMKLAACASLYPRLWTPGLKEQGFASLMNHYLLQAFAFSCLGCECRTGRSRSCPLPAYCTHVPAVSSRALGSWSQRYTLSSNVGWRPLWRCFKALLASWSKSSSLHGHSCETYHGQMW